MANAQQALKQKALGWNEGVDDGRGLRIVILKHCFDPNQMTNPTDYEVIVTLAKSMDNKAHYSDGKNDSSLYWTGPSRRYGDRVFEDGRSREGYGFQRKQ